MATGPVGGGDGAGASAGKPGLAGRGAEVIAERRSVEGGRQVAPLVAMLPHHPAVEVDEVRDGLLRGSPQYVGHMEARRAVFVNRQHVSVDHRRRRRQRRRRRRLGARSGSEE